MADAQKPESNEEKKPDPVQLYPAWRYHATEAAKIVQNKDEDEKLGDGWEDTPEKVKPAKKVEKAEKDSEPKSESKSDPEPEPPHPTRRKG